MTSLRTTFALIVLLAASAFGTTLEQLSLDRMIQESTAIVRAKVSGSRTAIRNGSIYTFYQVQVSESLKASSPASLEVAVPGGSLGAMMQAVAGAPELKAGTEYVLFLWTSRSGLTQIIGLTQGAFDVHTNRTGAATISRSAADEPMLDARGRAVEDVGLQLDMQELRTRVRAQRGGAR
jgi:hypothetical protein